MVIFFFVVYCLSLLVALGAMIVAGISDFRTMTIPNRYPVAIIAAFCIAFVFSRAMGVQGPFEPLAAHGLALGIVALVTFVMFALRIWGAGDSKLASAIALWAGLKGMVPFFMVMAFTGLGLVVLGRVLSYFRFFAADPAGVWPCRLKAGLRVLPYGIAIVGGGGAAFVRQGYFEFLPLLRAAGIGG
ncbi:MAG: prepilin peptidase [Micavibrio aeruginosavorus]|nr:prepilin peptidase [Micavibrio aeruginosavorus]